MTLLSHTIDDLNQAFQAFKQANNERLEALEKNKTDPLAEDQVQRLNTLLDEATVKLSKLSLADKRPSFQSHSPSDHEKKSFLSYLVHGHEEALRSLEKKALNGRRPDEGGVFLPESVESTLLETLLPFCPLRQIATVVQTNRHQYELVVQEKDSYSAWGESLGAEEKLQGSLTPKLTKRIYPLFSLMANPRLSASLLEDTPFHLEQWLMDILSKDMAHRENHAFIQGDGQTMPQGLLSVPSSKVESSSAIETLITGVNGAFSAAKPDEWLISLVYALRPEYLHNAQWLMSRSVLSEIRKMKTPQGHYLWNPPSEATPPSLLGYPLYISDDVPVLKPGTKSTSLFFGNFKEGYLIVDRLGISFLRDHFSAKPDIELLVRRRVGGGIRDFKAIKSLSFEAA